MSSETSLNLPKFELVGSFLLCSTRLFLKSHILGVYGMQVYELTTSGITASGPRISGRRRPQGLQERGIIQQLKEQVSLEKFSVIGCCGRDLNSF